MGHRRQFCLRGVPSFHPGQRVLNYLKMVRLSSGRMIWLLPHPLPLLSCQYKLDRRHTRRLRKREKVVSEEPNDTNDRKKAWSSANHSILFDAGITGLLGFCLQFRDPSVYRFKLRRFIISYTTVIDEEREIELIFHGSPHI